jgi:hypothetical protein
MDTVREERAPIPRSFLAKFLRDISSQAFNESLTSFDNGLLFLFMNIPPLAFS